MTTEPISDPKSLFDFSVKDAKGDLVNLSTYKGNVLLIVNVASKCGLTNSNYTELNQLYDKYKDQGLEILAFPCNQFREQEPETSDKIVEFVCTRFKSEFPIFDKTRGIPQLVVALVWFCDGIVMEYRVWTEASFCSFSLQNYHVKLASGCDILYENADPNTHIVAVGSNPSEM